MGATAERGRGPQGWKAGTMLPAEWRIGQLVPITFHIEAGSLDKWGSTPQPLCPSGAGGSGLSASLALRRPSGLPASGGPDGQGVLTSGEER